MNNFWSVDGVWTGKNARLFDNCEWSQNSNTDKEVNLDFTKWEWFKKVTDQMWVGSTDPLSKSFCYSLTTAATPAAGSYEGEQPRVLGEGDPYLTQVYKNLFHYVQNYWMPQERDFDGLARASDTVEFTLF